MENQKLAFLKTAFMKHKVCISDNGTKATVFNPFYDENIRVEYVEDDHCTPFIVYFSFQHCHLNDEADVIDWINEIVEGKKFAIEFFKNGKNRFGGDIGTEELADLSYKTLEHYYYGATKLCEIVDSFKIRGWTPSGNFDASFVFGKDGEIVIQKSIL